MNETIKKLTEETKAKLAAALGTKEIADFLIKAKAGNADNGRFKVVISTADLDRQGEIVDQTGWDLSFYQTNPVVLWAHDYYSLPIGVTDKIGLEDVGGGKKGLVAEGSFASEEANPFAQQVRRLYEAGIVRTTSVGFIAKTMEGNTVTTAELLEFSFVPVPANPYALTVGRAQKLGIDLAMLALKGIKIEEIAKAKSAIPYQDHGKAPEDEAWDAAKAQDEVWGDGTNQKKYAELHAWLDENAADDDGDGLPDVKGAYKLPHHDADLKANLNGVQAAMGALLGARGGVDIPDADRKAVYEHLAKHYAEFEKEPPEFKAEPPHEGEECTMDDGSMGVMQPDGNGALVCMPKPKADDDQQADDTLLKSVSDILGKATEDVIAAIKAEDALVTPDDANQNGQKGQKVGRRLSEKSKKSIQKAIEHLDAGNAALKELLAEEEARDGEGEDNSPDGSSPKQRSTPAGQANKDILAAFDGWRFNKEALQTIVTSAQRSLEMIKSAERVKARKG